MSTTVLNKKAKMNKQPDINGHFGEFGGSYVSETLMHALEELRDAYGRWSSDDEFVARMDRDLAHYVGRPSPLYLAERWSDQIGGARIYLKRLENPSLGLCLRYDRLSRRH